MRRLIQLIQRRTPRSTCHTTVSHFHFHPHPANRRTLSLPAEAEGSINPNPKPNRTQELAVVHALAGAAGPDIRLLPVTDDSRCVLLCVR